jgi:DUF917 family protein
MSKRLLTRELAETLTLGASFFGTGGGLERSNQLKIFDELFSAGKSLSMVRAEDLADDDIVCTAYAVGSAADTSFDLGASIKRALEALERVAGARFKAIFAGETNIEALVFQAAASVGLPVLDADCTGGRAVPEIQFDNFFVAGRSLLPLVAVTADGQVASLLEASDGRSVERFVRQLAINTGGAVAVVDHPIRAADARQALSLGVLERSLQLGMAVRSSRDEGALIEAVCAQLQGRLLLQGRMTDLDFDASGSTGFHEGYYTVRDERGDALKVYVKNENLLCWKNGEPLVTCPDLIVTIDLENRCGLHNSKVRDGMRVAVVAAPALPMWRSDRGQEIFSPSKLGFDIPVHLL